MFKRKFVKTRRDKRSYTGRFAPSPSGPLHIGSLVCAVASFLDARANGGRWLVRIEDIDPPREQAGAADNILKSLEQHDLLWDDQVLYQSSRSEAYRAALEDLQRAQLVYRCNCTRQRLKALPGDYDNHCRQCPPAKDEPAALRLNLSQIPATHNGICFTDGIQGEQCWQIRSDGDFCVHRKDGLFAYQLAVVLDDIFQNITHVVRGADLLDATAKQIALFFAFDTDPPAYAHHPVITDTQGRKLSKQNHAPALNLAAPQANLIQACRFLGMDIGSEHLTQKPSDILSWAIEHWDRARVPATKSGMLPGLG